ncbi:MAG: hypothetical protein KatS3mg114_0960 [Planctomycetaceae bacterium]|nr:MAG: hypothetical protein KatS3mg114_0960 [Planctomycetaceae bacterium]
MKYTRMLVLLALLVGVGRIASGQGQTERDREQVRRDEVLIAVQQICPVSGQKLGEHGTPIKVTIGEQKEQVFLCCRGCLQQKVEPKHWATIHANFAKAQRVCPVMKQELPQSPKWTIVEGHVVYVCCPPCTKKIEADPKAFVRQIDQLYAASLKDRAQER